MSKKNRGLRYRYVDSIEDMQYIFEMSNKYAPCYLSSEAYSFDGVCPLRTGTHIIDGDRYYKLTSMWIKDTEHKDGTVTYDTIFNSNGGDKYVCTWIFDKTGEHVSNIHPSKIARMIGRIYKPNKIISENGDDEFDRNKDNKLMQTAKPILGYSKKFDLTEHNVVIYDLNSAYAEPLTNKIIDTYARRDYGFVEANEVGFLFDDNLTIRHEGEYADVIFPLIDSPYKEFVKEQYQIKKTAPKGSKERAIAKQILVIMVGLWQNINPYLRAYIVNTCNEKIKYFLKKYKNKTCMWNTDALYCTERIPELDNLIGEEIGQFKIEYEGLFRQKGLNYQKVNEEDKNVSYRGVMKTLFESDFNILTDPLPKAVLPYKINKNTLKLEINKEYEYGKKI